MVLPRPVAFWPRRRRLVAVKGAIARYEPVSAAYSDGAAARGDITDKDRREERHIASAHRNRTADIAGAESLEAAADDDRAAAVNREPAAATVGAAAFERTVLEAQRAGAQQHAAAINALGVRAAQCEAA